MGMNGVKVKINILKVASYCQPNTQGFIAPPGNADWGVEQDFHAYLLAHSEITTTNPSQADWYYLPVYWNRYYIVHDWGSKGLDELKCAVDHAMDDIDGSRVFTVCEYDLFALSSQIELRGGLVMCASKRGPGRFIDIPLLRSPHAFSGAPKWIFASFTGNTQTDGIRQDMERACEGLPGVICNHAFKDPVQWAKMVESSYIALCPRGQGAASFRFYEAMQLGTVPMHIGEPDVRPFKRAIDWDEISLYAPTVNDMLRLFGAWRASPWLPQLTEMGRRAKFVYDKMLAYGMWPALALQELEALE